MTHSSHIYTLYWFYPVLHCHRFVGSNSIQSPSYGVLPGTIMSDSSGAPKSVLIGLQPIVSQFSHYLGKQSCHLLGILTASFQVVLDLCTVAVSQRGIYFRVNSCAP